MYWKALLVCIACTPFSWCSLLLDALFVYKIIIIIMSKDGNIILLI